MNDTDLAALVRDAVRDTHMTVPESDITRRARRLRTRRRAAAGGAAVAGLAAGLGVAALAAPASSTATGHAQNSAQLTGWTVTKDPGGVIVTMLLGVAGSFVAGFLGRSIGHYQPGDRPGLIASVIGAIILLGCYRLYLRATHRHTPEGGSQRLTRP